MQDAERRSIAVRLAVFFSALFAGYGVNVPYFPLWLDARGLSAGEISLVLAMPAIVRIATTPALAFLADRRGAHRSLLIAASVVAALATLALATAHGFWPILLVGIVVGAATAALLPLSETVAMHGVQEAGLDYGQMRLWGSVAFVGASFAGGALLARHGTTVVVWTMAACAAATLLAAVLLPRRSGGQNGTGSGKPGIRLVDVVALATWPPFLWFVAAAAATQAAHAVIYAFGSLHWRAQGIGPGWIGTLWAIGVVVEIALFAVSGAAVRRVGPLVLLMVAAGAALVRWTAMATDPPLWALVALQMLHGATFGAAHLGGMHFIARAVPQQQAGTAQALYATVVGAAMAVSTLAIGDLYARFGGGAYLVMSALAGLGMVAAARLSATWDGTPIDSNHAA